jgi:PAS domain S-box-containing protein
MDIDSIDGSKDMISDSMRITDELSQGSDRNDLLEKQVIALKKAEEQIAMLAFALKSISECVCISDMDDNILFVNEPFLKTYGYTSDELIGKQVSKVRSANNKTEIVTDIFPQTLKGGWKGELMNMHKDGNEFPVFISTSVVYNDLGNPVAVMGIARDITDTKKAEANLRESETKFKSIFDRAHDAIFIMDNDCFIDCNQSTGKIFGVTAEQILGCSPWDFSPVNQPDGQLSKVKARVFIESAMGGTPQLFDWVHTRLDGTPFYAEVSLNRIMLKEKWYLQAIVRDMTKRKQVEEALQEKANELERFNRLMIGRELKMIELKKEINELLEKLDKPQKYNIDLKTKPTESFPDSRFEQAEQLFQQSNLLPEHTIQAALNLMEDLKAEVDQRKLSEMVLKESQQKFRDLSIMFSSISDNMTDMLWAKDMDKKYIFTNKSFCDNLLIAENTHEPIGKDDLFFANRQRKLYPDDPAWHTFGELCMNTDDVVMASGKPEQFDEYGNVKGNFLFLDVRKSPLYDMNGRMIGTVGSAQDRTKEREMSKQLAQRERQLSTLVSNLPGMVYRSLDGDAGEMLFVSDGCLTVTGYSREDFVEHKTILFNDLILGEYRGSVLQKWQKVLSEGEIFEGEYPIRTANGEIKWVWERCRGVYTETGEILYVEGYIADVTEHMKAVESLRESEQRYQTFINSIDDFAFLKDENFRYLFINNANAAFFGKETAEIIGLDDFQLMQEDYARNCRTADINAIARGGVVINEEVVEGKIFESRKFPVTLRNGHTGVGGYIRDISDRKVAEEVINKMNDELELRVLERTSQLEAANKELEAFSYSVSHDLRAPLRAIDGFARILSEDYQATLDEEGRRVCKVIQDNAIRMGQLIDDLLALSRLNRTNMHITRINMESLAQIVYNEISNPRDKLRIKFNISSFYPAMGDQVAVRQVLVNLISNAIKFSAQRELAEITLTSEKQQKMVVYCITDNGAGFDMKYSDKLFGAFQRLHSVKEFDGTGIGLAIVQRIIHRHGGKVWAMGEVDKGASFYFSLPLKIQTKE